MQCPERPIRACQATGRATHIRMILKVLYGLHDAPGDAPFSDSFSTYSRRWTRWSIARRDQNTFIGALLFHPASPRALVDKFSLTG